jgi:hypothetical protein
MLQLGNITVLTQVANSHFMELHDDQHPLVSDNSRISNRMSPALSVTHDPYGREESISGNEKVT